MSFFVSMPFRFSGVLCIIAARNNRNLSALFDPADKFVAGIHFIGEDQPSCQFERFQHFFRQTNIVPVAAGKPKCNGFPRSSVRVWTLVVNPPDFIPQFHHRPFLASLACWCTSMVVLSNISVVSSTISCWINFVGTFSHTPFFVHAWNRLYTLCQGPNLPASLAMGCLYSANIPLHGASLDCSLPADLLAAFVLAATSLLFSPIVLHLVHVFS